jgi:hypothetical protein
MRKSFFLFIIIISGFLAKADEGSWLPLLVERLNYTDMQKLGLNLTAEEIYSINKSCIKDAIISINHGFGSGAIISDNGLAITSHRCIFNALQKYATSENDYYQDGFWAKSQQEELRCEGFSATFLVRIENVSDKVLSKLNETMTETERHAKIDEISKFIEDEAVQGTKYNAEVKSFKEGNEFYLFVYETYTDVRLVGIPSLNIGYYGGDKENWCWPKFAGDFSLIRIYSSPNGDPAPYNKNNVPLKPKYVLPVSLKGYQKGDFVMTLGYAYNNTNRYITASGIKLLTEQVNPAIVKVRNIKLGIIKSYMDQDKDIRVQYAAKYKESDNYLKYFQDQSEQLKRFNSIELCKKLESDFTNWLNSNADHQKKYGKALDIINNANDEIKKYNLSKYYYQEAILQGPEIFAFALRFDPLVDELNAKIINQSKIDSLLIPLRYYSKKFLKNYNSKLDKDVFAAMIKLYYSDIPKEQYPEVLQDIDTKYKGDISRFADAIYDSTIFTSNVKMNDFFLNPSFKIIKTDLVFKLIKSFEENIDKINGQTQSASLELEKGYRLLLAGLMEYKNTKFYSNTNSTMRLTYGKVNDYTDEKNQTYGFCTTMDQLLAKDNPQDNDFAIPSQYSAEFKKGNFGRYASKGKLNISFISDNDVCGGYSGSPVLNKNGQLIGVDCDLNHEATAGQYTFNPKLMRAVNTDIRYILYIVDKCAGANYLLKEMKIVEN